MKIILSLFLALTFAFTLAFGQHPYYDALKLKKYVADGKFAPEDSAQLDTIYNIFKLYKYTDSDTSNPFLIIFKSDGGGLSVEDQKKIKNINLSSFVNSVSGIDVTSIANGVAMLMIDRAKQELTVTFFNRFKKFAEDNPEFKVLFPKTADNLKNLLAYKYPEMLPALRSSFHEDINKITYNLDDVLELPRYRKMLEKFPEIKITIRSIRLIHELESGESHVADILKKFANFEEWKVNGSNAFKNFGSSVKLAAIFSESLRYVPSITTTKDTVKTNVNGILNVKETILVRSPVFINGLLTKKDSLVVITTNTSKSKKGKSSIKADTVISVSPSDISSNEKKAWVSLKEIKEQLLNDTTFKIYLGLLYQQVKNNNISWGVKDNKGTYSSISFADVMREHKNNLFLFENKVTEFIELAETTEKLIDSLKEKKEQKIALKTDDYYSYINASLNVIDYGFSIAGLFNDSLNVKEYTLIARKSNDLYRHIYKKEYTQALSNGMDILKGVGKMVNESDTTGFKDSLKLLTKVLPKLTKYGLFIANIASTDKPEEIRDVLDNAILPVGSSSIKKNSDFNLSVQSYLGASALLNPSIGNKGTGTAWTDKFGVFAPVGLSVSYGLNKGADRNYGSISLFGSLFDLGAIVDYQLKKDSVVTTNGTSKEQITKEYKIKLGQIISPGVYLVYGFFGNIPLSLGFGAQYGPGLSKIEAPGNAVFNNPQWRWNAFLSVDIPFFNLVNRFKNKY